MIVEPVGLAVYAAGPFADGCMEAGAGGVRGVPFSE